VKRTVTGRNDFGSFYANQNAIIEMNLSFTFPGGTFPFVAACLPACLPAPVSLACERLCAPGQTDRRRQAQYSQLIRSFVCYQVCKTKK